MVEVSRKIIENKVGLLNLAEQTELSLSFYRLPHRTNHRII